MRPEEIHRLGLDEVRRIRSEMTVLASRINHNGPLDAFLQSVNSDRRYYYSNGDELLTAYRDAVARIDVNLSKVVGISPNAPFILKPVYHGGVAAMYNTLERVVLVEVGRPELRPKFEIIPLMLHEGVPGHHLAVTSAAKAHQSLRHSAGFSEGWAVYAETLGEEMGLYADPYDKLGQLSMELMRAVRLVIDTGVNQFGWSRDKARQYFVSETGKSGSIADFEVSRAAMPGSLLAYKIGELRFKAMKERAKTALGERFDLRVFHDALLGWGPLPLAVLERKFDECLSDRRCLLWRDPPQPVKP
jgi:uncharacterized protein (DUF885 family)